MLLAGCTKDVVDTTGTLQGIVTDSRTGAFVPGASVSLSPSGKTVTTGADGKFTFNNVETGDYRVTASKSNYRSDSKQANVLPGQVTDVDFQLTPSTGYLKVSAGQLDFGNDHTSLTFEILNEGEARFDWHLTEDAPWLSCNPTSGRIQAGEKATVVVTVDRTGMERGSWSQTIAVASDAGSAIVTVRMSVQGITVSLSPDQLDFGANSTSLPLTLTNNGSGTVSYSLSLSNAWLRTDRKSGSFSKSETITVSVDRTGLGQGDYSGTLEVAVGGSVLTVPVRMAVQAKELPLVATKAAEANGYNSARFEGAVVSVGSSPATAHGFCWSETESPDTGSAMKCNFGDTGKPRDFSYTAVNLEPSTRYYVRAYAVNQEGTAYGAQLTFKTNGLPTAPGVATGEVSAITDSSASVAGNLESLGNLEEITAYGHVWSTKPTPTTSDAKSDFGATDRLGGYNTAMTGLLPSTTYHVRAYARNAAGVSYGEERTFRTKSASSIELEGYGPDINWKP